MLQIFRLAVFAAVLCSGLAGWSVSADDATKSKPRQVELDREQVIDRLLNEAAVHLGGHAVEQDLKKGRELLEEAVTYDSAVAKTALGSLLFRGVGGPKDIKRAIDLLETAAAQDDANAMEELFYIYVNGEGGVRKNIVLARIHAEIGSRLGHAPLMLLKAKFHNQGLDGRVDLSASWFYSDTAARLGDEEALDYVRELETRMTPQQVAEAKDRQWKWFENMIHFRIPPPRPE